MESALSRLEQHRITSPPPPLLTKRGNYSAWRASMERYFTHEGLLPFLLGPVLAPIDHRHLEDFLDTCNHIFGHMMMHVSRSLWFHMANSDPPHCVWSILQSFYRDPSHIVVIVVAKDSVVSSSSCDDSPTDIDSLGFTSDDEDCASSFDVESTTEDSSPLSLTIPESVDTSHISSDIEQSSTQSHTIITPASFLLPVCKAHYTPLPSLDDSYLSDITLLFIEPPHWDEYLPDLSHLFAESTCDALQVLHPSIGVSEEFVISVVGSAPSGILTTSTFSETFIDPPSVVDPFFVVEYVLFPSHHVDILSTSVHSSHSDSSTHVALPLFPWHSLARPMSHFRALDSKFFVLLPSISFVEWA
ncbi:hypothetical protein KI387_015957 [Taxus chinensis]|uniref:Uncharacterized protein n=1 Tax=Taxus chinensis TaxID=29808 RepID=A0AA38LDN6_TAXCH|nr:hypothetical protein KI387_015957 [Taxus chinensis]